MNTTNNITFIHSFWTKPCYNERWNVKKTEQIINNIWYYSTSVAYLKKLNQRIELHTDNFGKKCMDHIPYDTIHLTLNSIPPQIKPYIWAYGKFWSFKNCNINAVHIDGDVFIKSKKCIDAILENDYDLLIQNHEHIFNSNYKHPLYRAETHALQCIKYPSWSSRHCQDAYNTGIIKFNNQKFKDAYLDNYFKYAEICSNNTKLDKHCNDKSIAPDLIIEQQFIFELAKHMNISTKKLISYYEATKSANTIGYQHIIGKAKYDADVISKCKQTLYILDKNLYNMTDEKIKQITKFIDNASKHII